MNQLKLHLLLLATAALTACVGQTYRVDAGAMFAKASGDIALQNAVGSLGLFENQNDLDSDLGVGDTEPSPYLRVQMDQEKHRVRLHGFGVDATGSGTLAPTSAFGNIPGGSQVTTSMDFFAVGGTYAFQVLRDEHFRIAVGAALNFYSLDVTARSTTARESVKTNVVVPMPYAEAEATLGAFSVGGNAGLMSADLGDANGRYLDIETYLRWQAVEQVDVMIGYRYLVLDGYGRATSRDFDADVDVQGLFVGGGVRF